MESSRREFLRRAACVIAAHQSLPAFGQPAVIDTKGQRPVEFERIRLRTSKLDAMRDYYANTLSLPARLDAGVLTVKAGRSTIEFTAAATGADPYYHFAFNIPENKLEASMKWLRPRCPIFKQAGSGQEIYNFATWNAHSCYFHDPSGNILEFIARHTLPNGSRGDFDVSDVLSVSEIALVAPDLTDIASRLKSGAGVHDYGAVSSGFMPIGNEHGLFILMKTGREMLGGTAKAAQYPVEVRMRADRRERITWDALPFVVETSA